MKCDLHVHTIHSGMCTVSPFRRICRESYSDPLAVYETLKRRGMDLVTITDHDSVDAADALRNRPDFFLSEEVTCWTPVGTCLHVGVYDINERQHQELQRRREDFVSLLAYLGEQKLFFSVNHPFAGITGARIIEDFDLMDAHFPAIETLNGQIGAASNSAAAELAEWLGKASVGGSDAHTLRSLGATFTEVPSARTKKEYLEGLQRRQGRIGGESGGFWKLTRAILDISGGLVRERPWTVALTPLIAAIPVATLLVCLFDFGFAKYWSPRLRSRFVTMPGVARGPGFGATA